MNEPINNNNQNQPNGGMVFNVPNQPPVNPMPTGQNMTLGAAVNNQTPVTGAPTPEPTQQPMNVGPAAAPLTPPVAPSPVPAEPTGQPMPNPMSMPNQTVNPMPTNNGGLPPVGATPTAPAPETPKEEKPKAKTNPIAYVVLILFAVAALGAVLYYFVLDKPNKAFASLVNDTYASVPITETKNTFTNYDVKLKVVTSNEQYKAYTSLFDKLGINVTMGQTDDGIAMNGLLSYDNTEVLNYSMLTKENIAYLKLNNLYDKVLEMNTATEELPVEASVNINDIDSEKMIKAVKNALDKALEKANYTKEITDLGSDKVKKYTLTIDSTFTDTLYNELSGNADFMKGYATMSGGDEANAKVTLKEELTNLAQEKVKIQMYTPLLKKELKKLSISSSSESIVITPNNDTYNFSYSENGTAVFNGYIEYKKTGEDGNINLNINIPSMDLGLTVNTAFSNFKDMNILDPKDAIKLEELSEEEMNTITNKLMDNKGVQSLIKDLGLDELE